MHTTSGGRVTWQLTSDDENSYSHWAAQQLRGRSRRGRSSPSECGSLAYSKLDAQTIRTFKPAVTAFLQALQQLGWTDGRNVRIDTRWSTSNADNIRKHVAELVALKPDLIVASGTSTAVPLVQATCTVPIVFMGVTDPVSSGLVDSLSRPGRNATGFMQFEYGLTAKWPELLKEIAPGVKRVAVLRNPIKPRRDRPVRHHTICGIVGRRGVEPCRRAQHRGHRACRDVTGSHRQWRSDCDGGRLFGASSRIDHQAGRPCTSFLQSTSEALCC